jgi:hypothetical protein
MPEQTTDRDRELRRKLGISRRDLMRRGLIIGGTLVWTVPIIESISREAFAAKGSPEAKCCACGTKKSGGDDYVCVTGSDLNQMRNSGDCAQYCKDHYGSGQHKYKFENGPHGTICCEPHTGCRKASRNKPC